MARKLAGQDKTPGKLDQVVEAVVDKGKVMGGILVVWLQKKGGAFNRFEVHPEVDKAKSQIRAELKRHSRAYDLDAMTASAA